MNTSPVKILHAVDGQLVDANVVYGVTIFVAENGGVLIWAGRLHPSALAKSGEQIEQGDYMELQAVSFPTWEETWSYLERHSKFSPLVSQLRTMQRRTEA